MVPNHSSYKCEWFQKSIEREGKFTDYYFWLNASNQNEIDEKPETIPLPPNNWV